MNEKGIGQTSTFYTYHPVVNMLYYLFTIGITMFSMSPLFLCAAFCLSFSYSYVLNGKREIKRNLIITLVIVITMATINMLFTHNGESVLFYLNSNRITLEALFYGIAAAFMLSAVIIWFKSFTVVMSSDKIIYLFGKGAPVIGLVISMIFRFMPLLKNRFDEIDMGQKCMGRGNVNGIIPRTKLLLKEASILVAWSLEASIESADSMASRGYGLKGRSSFHLYKMIRRDVLALSYILILGVIAVIGCLNGYGGMIFYPTIKLPEISVPQMTTLISYIMLAAMPIALDIIGEYRWEKLHSTI